MVVDHQKEPGNFVKILIPRPGQRPLHQSLYVILTISQNTDQQSPNLFSTIHTYKQKSEDVLPIYVPFIYKLCYILQH